ncbi:unnamed protein product, partial [Aphanomyces euteiches]
TFSALLTLLPRQTKHKVIKSNKMLKRPMHGRKRLPARNQLRPRKIPSKAMPPKARNIATLVLMLLPMTILRDARPWRTHSTKTLVTWTPSLKTFCSLPSPKCTSSQSSWV